MKEAGIDSKEANAALLKPPKKICGIPVKEGVSCFNLFMIPYVPMVVMVLTTYVNA